MKKTASIMLAIALFSCTDKETKKSISITATSEYERPTKAAIKFLDGYIGCKFLAYGGKPKVTVKGLDGNVCGQSIESEEGAGLAYSCGGGRYEIIVKNPQTIDVQTCIILHELGHVLGLRHSSIGIMSSCKPGKRLLVRDADVADLRKEYCK